MNDKPFDPVTEGTPTQWAEYVEAECSAYITNGTLDAIAARDVAMQERGRLMGLEEAAEICRRWVYTCNAIAAIRAAAETAKEGEDV